MNSRAHSVKAMCVKDDSKRDREGVIKRMRVELRDSESFDSLLKRFTKEVQKSGLLRDFRSKRRFVSKSEQRRAKARKAEHKRRRKEAKTAPR